jgi:hypothetical protein
LRASGEHLGGSVEQHELRLGVARQNRGTEQPRSGAEVEHPTTGPAALPG